MHGQPTRIFQFVFGREMVLNEFDLAGCLKRSTSFETEFDDYKIMANDHKRIRMLMTPKAEDYFKVLLIKEI